MNWIELNTGRKIPNFGIGTYQIKEEDDIVRVLDSALENGYRLIDSAAVYKNEAHIGKHLPTLLKKHGLSREDVFITTKLSPQDMGTNAVAALHTSLKNLGLSYVDLYLIHWPGTQGLQHGDEKNASFRKDTWLALVEEFKNSSTMRSLGVSNFKVRHLKELESYSDVTPAVLQNEFHPDYLEVQERKYCEEKGIYFQAYSSLGQAKLVNDARFIEVAKKHDKSVNLVLLRWGFQHGCGIIPMSKNPQHIAENAGVFDFSLDDSDMQVIADCSKKEKYAWDPKNIC